MVPKTLRAWPKAHMRLFRRILKYIASERPMPAHRWLGVRCLTVRESHGMGQPCPQMTDSVEAEPQVPGPHLPHCLALVWTTRPHGRRGIRVYQPREAAAGWSCGRFRSSVLAVIFLDELDVSLSKAVMNQ